MTEDAMDTMGFPISCINCDNSDWKMALDGTEELYCEEYNKICNNTLSLNCSKKPCWSENLDDDTIENIVDEMEFRVVECRDDLISCVETVFKLLYKNKFKIVRVD